MEAGIYMRQSPKAANEQTGAADEEYRQGEFADDENGADAASGR